MLKSKRLMMITSGFLLGAVILTTGVSALATEKSPKENGKKFKTEKKFDLNKQGKKINKHEDLKNVLSQLVKEGTITQEDMNKITAYLDAKKQEKKQNFKEGKDGTKIDIFTDMVNKGLISKSKADAIKDRLHSLKEAKRKERLDMLNKQLDTLVEKGTITKEQKNQILSYMEQRHQEKQAEHEKIKNMTKEEREKYFKSKEFKKQNILSEMVEKGIITKSQSEALKEIFPKSNKPFKGHCGI
ncbi:hypothetical protein Q428_02475 [Fervidicella metallireducens AeB]|uniref:CARD domain-containing protein n=1 Tax=Fervidicella metallireducens AeB TaxID=1403537 RepID=A0A017S005_9CLOT|nr:hypothetical protein [Fervidicella metallireducens]EYE89500.1 hypothetical protein Q428_02475 [Fervidicella metallireducens AeB]